MSDNEQRLPEGDPRSVGDGMIVDGAAREEEQVERSITATGENRSSREAPEQKGTDAHQVSPDELATGGLEDDPLG